MKAIKLLAVLALLLVPVTSAFASDDCAKKCEKDPHKDDCMKKCEASHKH